MYPIVWNEWQTADDMQQPEFVVDSNNFMKT